MNLFQGKINNTMRGVLVFSYVFVIVVVYLTWAIVCFVKGALMEMAIIAALSTTIIGIVTSGKFFEKREETKQQIQKDKAGENCE